MANDEITIRGDFAYVTGPEGKTVRMTLKKLMARAAPRSIDSCGIGLPPEVRFTYSRGPMTVLVCEYPAGPYNLSWIADDSLARHGEGTTYRQVSISLPYVIVLAVFEQFMLTDYNECFFRRAPLDDVDSENQLLYPGLLNCSRFEPPDGKPLSWICTQKLDRSAIRRQKDPRRHIRAGLHTLRNCLFTTGFNYSSDDNEYSSWWSESRALDPRIETVDRWHKETLKDRYLGLDIPWLKTNKDLASVVDRVFSNRGIDSDDVRHSRQLARLIMNNQ